MEKIKVIEKIKKLLKVAADSAATESEVLAAVAMADKLRIKYKIENSDLMENDVAIHEILGYQIYGYKIAIVNVLAEHFRCKALREGRLNGLINVHLFGYSEDLEILKPILEKVLEFVGNKIKKMKSLDKKSYICGFAAGLKENLKKSLLEMKDISKFEIVALTSVPVEVEDLANGKTRKTRSSQIELKRSAYERGYKQGLKYSI